jgi:hypothetical protein
MSGNEDTENETCSSACRKGGTKQELCVLCSLLQVFVNCLSEEIEYYFVNENSVALIDG